MKIEEERKPVHVGEEKEKKRKEERESDIGANSHCRQCRIAIKVNASRLLPGNIPGPHDHTADAFDNLCGALAAGFLLKEFLRYI